MTNKLVVVIVEGGVVQETYADPGIDVVIVDHDDVVSEDGMAVWNDGSMSLDNLNPSIRELVNRSIQ